MGSALAAVRTGLISSVYFSGAAAAFNALVLLSFKSQVLVTLAQYYSNCAGTGPATQSGTAGYCFNGLFTGPLLFFFLQLLIISFFFSLAYGMFFEALPGGTSYFRKALLMSMIMLVAILFTATPTVGDIDQLALVISAEVALAPVMSFLLARLYRRFTREVSFQAQDSDVKIMVGRRNQTGKMRTFAVGASADVEVESEGHPFKGWVVSGGVTVDDPKSPSTTIRINGDGLLKAT